MAYPVHCAYCFESISASFDKRKPPSLNSVEELWAEYETRDEPTSAGAPRLPAITRLAAPSSSSVSSAAPSASSSTPSLNTNASSATSVSSDSSGRGGLLGLAGRLTRSKRQGQGQTQKYPLFVTWDTKSRSGNKSLRGCIGTFEAQELEDGLLGYARTSAFEDTRFMPITQKELPSLQCSITLLTDFEPASDAMDWDIGTHGLRISFHANGRRYGSTYLPDVAAEQGWTKEESLVSLMRKAGWSGHRADWKKVELKVVRYQGKRASLSYQEWRDWRNWLEATGRDLTSP